MEQSQIPKWQQQVEEILREKFQGDRLKMAYELVELANEVEVPTGDVALILRLASKDLPPLTMVYAGFMLGVAWERLNKGEKKC